MQHIFIEHLLCLRKGYNRDTARNKIATPLSSWGSSKQWVRQGGETLSKHTNKQNHEISKKVSLNRTWSVRPCTIESQTLKHCVFVERKVYCKAAEQGDSSQAFGGRDRFDRQKVMAWSDWTFAILWCGRLDLTGSCHKVMLLDHGSCHVVLTS